MSRVLFPWNPSSLCGNGSLWDHQLGLSCRLSTVLTRKLKPGLWMCLWNWTQPTSLLSESQVMKIKNIQKNRFFSFQATEMLLSYKIKNISPNILNTNSRQECSFGEFPGSPVVRTLCFYCSRPRSSPWSENWDLASHTAWQKEKMASFESNRPRFKSWFPGRWWSWASDIMVLNFTFLARKTGITQPLRQRVLVKIK